MLKNIGVPTSESRPAVSKTLGNTKVEISKISIFAMPISISMHKFYVKKITISMKKCRLPKVNKD